MDDYYLHTLLQLDGSYSVEREMNGESEKTWKEEAVLYLREYC